MSSKFSDSKKRTALLVCCTLLYIFLIFVSQMISRSGNRVLMIGANSIPAFSLNGILQALQFFLCICMVSVDYKRGRVISSLLIALSIFFNIMEIVMAHVLNSLP